MKKIILTQGKFAKVDDADFEELNKYKWCVGNFSGRYYATRRKDGKMVLLHRELMNYPANSEVDHVNNDSLDNRRKNLRVCSHLENSRNRGRQKNNKSGHKGVCWSKWHNKWEAQIWVNGKVIHAGFFIQIEDAIQTYNRLSSYYFGSFNYTEKATP